jgi:hypothetical protein
LSNQITALQKEVSLSEAALRQEKLAHNTTKDELENLRNQMSVVMALGESGLIRGVALGESVLIREGLLYM